MTPTLAKAFLNVPLAHRALHDKDQNRPENSMAAIQAAIDANYGIEIDVQLSADNMPVVFHDYDLERLTGGRGAVNRRKAEELHSIPLTGGDGAGIPSLTDVLARVAGQVPLLIEIKDQDGALGTDVGVLEAGVATAINDYAGPVAVMSFNPHSVAAMQTLAPDIPRGLVTEDFRKGDWRVNDARAAALARIEDYERVGACFISHDWEDLQNPRVADLKAGGAQVITWTIRSSGEEKIARTVAENITFEGYLPTPQA